MLTGAALNPLVGALVGRLDARLITGAGVLAAALGLLALSLAAHPWQTAAAMALLGASNALLLAPATTLIGDQGISADPPVLGAAYAAFNLACATGLFLGPLLGGGATSVAGFTTAVLALAVLAATLGLSAIPRLPTALMDLSAADEQPAGPASRSGPGR